VFRDDLPKIEHNLCWTHPEEVKGALLGFLADTTAALESAA
jgi:hypothetical protein